MLAALTSQVRVAHATRSYEGKELSWAFSKPIRTRLSPRDARRVTNRAGILVVLGIAASIAGCKGEAAVQEQVVRPVKVAVVAAATQGRTLTYSGVVRPRIESALGFRVPGKIVARVVNVGDRVEVGQVIARLDETDLKLAETAARAAVAAARSRRDVANDNLERANVLLPKAIISQAAHDTRRNELDAAAAALESAEAQLRQAVNAVDYATLKADKAGIVTSVTGEPGQVVGAGQAIVSLAESGETEIAVAVPEQDAARLAIGQPAKASRFGLVPRASASMGGFAKLPARPTQLRAPMRFALPWNSRRRPCGSA